MNFRREEFDRSLIPYSPIRSFLFLGLVEGEGTFGFKKYVSLFSNNSTF